MLVFIAPDETRNSEWEDSIRKYLAWKSIEREREELNLDAQQSRQVAEASKRESETVDKRLQETYSWMIVPRQPDRTQPVTLEQERLSGIDEFLVRAARKLRNNEWLIHGLSPDNLLMELEPLGWSDLQHLSIKKLWDWLTNYCYLPRLFDRNVLEETIKDGVKRLMPAFAYATGVDEGGTYHGLTMGGSFTLYFDDNAVIVKPEVARAQLDAEQRVVPSPEPPKPGNGGGGGPKPPPPGPPPAKPKTRYYGTKQIDPKRPMRDLSQIVEEIISRLAAEPGTDLAITLEIRGDRAAGFDDATVRTVSENSHTLNLDDHGFED